MPALHGNPTEEPVLSKREAKRRNVLNAAACQMNERGATSVSLNGVAKSVGLSRNALYYYFKDRLDLVYACYLEASEAQAADLEQTLLHEGDTADKLRFFIEQTLLTDRQERAVLSDLAMLSEPQRLEIDSINQKNTATLELILQEGIESEVLRPVNVAMAAQMLLGLLSWVQLWHKWLVLDASSLENHRATAADTISHIFLYGVSSDRNYKYKCPFSLKALLARKVNAFDPSSINEEKRLQLLGASSLLFNQRGMDATSLDDIAEYIGATKGAVYHYYKDKPSLVDSCYQHAFEQYEQISNIADEKNTSGLHRLLNVFHLNCQAQASANPPLILQAGIANQGAKYLVQATAIAMKLQRIRLEAIKDGSARSVDQASVELSPGAFFWISKWLGERPDISDEQLADSVCEIFTTGVLR
jgi:AcrR family transcriptional regulator